jgi:hypothetical protein
VCVCSLRYPTCKMHEPYHIVICSLSDSTTFFPHYLTHHTNSPNWETLASRRKLSHICALFKAYSGERAWKAIRDRLQRPHYLSRVDHERKIRSRRQRTDLRKYSYVNRTIQHWNQLPADVLESLPCKQITFKKRVR